MEDLLPCPFCGGEVEVVRNHIVGGADWIRHLSRPLPCGIEGFSGFYGLDKSVEAAWNTRIKNGGVGAQQGGANGQQPDSETDRARDQ